MKFATMMLIGLALCAAEACGAPQTLAALAGARAEPGKLSDSVLIIIDAQREYVDGALPLANVNDAINEIGKLLARARKAGTPVIHVVHTGGGKLFNPATPQFEIVAPLHPADDETVIRKSRTSAFADTPLGDVLTRIGRRNLIIVGFMTHHCVSSTARAARDRGYAPTVIAAATATRDLPDGKGGVVPASALQTASLAALGDMTAIIVRAADDIAD